MRRRDEDQLLIRKGGRGCLATLVMIILPSLVQGQTASAQCSTAHRRREREREGGAAGASELHLHSPYYTDFTLRFVAAAHVVYSIILAFGSIPPL